MITASKIERIEICPPSAVLPQVATVDDPYANHGSAVHGYLAEVGTLGKDEALARVPPEHHAACAALDLDKLPVDPKAYAPEVAFALHPETGAGRELGRNIGRSYRDHGLVDPEWGGSADVVGLTADGRAVVILDFKSGRRCTPARDNGQLRFLALAAARAYRRPHALVGLVYLDLDGDSWCDRAELDAFDLDEIADGVWALESRVRHAAGLVDAGKIPSFTTGDHCRRCPALPHCPAQVALVRQLAARPDELLERGVFAQLTPEGAAHAYRRYREIKLILDRASQAIYAYALMNAIPLGDGLIYGPVERKTREVHGAVTRMVLAEQYGASIADAACTWKATLEGVNQAARLVAAQREVAISKVEAEMLDAIKAAGGLHTNVAVVVKEHRPKKGKGENAA